MKSSEIFYLLIFKTQNNLIIEHVLNVFCKVGKVVRNSKHRTTEFKA
jgi:hypothetical protein